jgi:hypothetical protein
MTAVLLLRPFLRISDLCASGNLGCEKGCEREGLEIWFRWVFVGVWWSFCGV